MTVTTVWQEKRLEEIEEQGDRESLNGSEYKKLCQLRGLITDDVEELNELGETKLLAAAAEGWCVRIDGPDSDLPRGILASCRAPRLI